MEKFQMEPQNITKRGKFTTYEGVEIEDLGTYVTGWLEQNADHGITIHVGCDSHVGSSIKYRTSLCFLREGKGGHIISKDDYAPNNMTINERLMNEVVLSLEVADSLKHLGLEITIHVDYNSDPKHKSNEMYATGIGTGAWFGYKTLGKPLAWAASKVADKGTRTRKSRKYYRKLKKNKQRSDRS
jgi:predicted RNase H-related nuclease YkuK (DUF458 family)